MYISLPNPFSECFWCRFLDIVITLNLQRALLITMNVLFKKPYLGLFFSSNIQLNFVNIPLKEIFFVIVM